MAHRDRQDLFRDTDYSSTLITVLSTPRSKLNLRDVCTRRHDGNFGVPKKQTAPKGRARVKGREVETVSHITCFSNLQPRFAIIVRIVWIAPIVAKYESRPSRRLYGNHALQTRKGRGLACEAQTHFRSSTAGNASALRRLVEGLKPISYSFYL